MKKMKRHISKTPQRWVVLKLPNKHYKVFATWGGGYLSGDSWRLNSGISKVEQDKDFYYFYGFSGSCYRCHKKGYGTATSYGLNVLNQLTKRKSVRLMKDRKDWTKLNTII